ATRSSWSPTTLELQQMESSGVFIFASAAANIFDQPVEGIFDVPTQQVKVCHGYLRCDVVGVLCGICTDLLHVSIVGALHEPNTCFTTLCFIILRVFGKCFVVGRDGLVVIFGL